MSYMFDEIGFYARFYWNDLLSFRDCNIENENEMADEAVTISNATITIDRAYLPVTPLQNK